MENFNFREPRFFPCSGQGKGARSWSVYDSQGPLWWRPKDKRGKMIRYTLKGAYAAAAKLNSDLGLPISELPEFLR